MRILGDYARFLVLESGESNSTIHILYICMKAKVELCVKAQELVLYRIPSISVNSGTQHRSWVPCG